MCSWFIPFFTITFIEGLIDPRFIEGDIFHTIIPSSSQVTVQADKEIEKLLECCTTPRTRGEMQEFMQINHRECFRSKILNPLIKRELLKRTIPDKPTSPNQKYYTEKRDRN